MVKSSSFVIYCIKLKSRLTIYTFGMLIRQPYLHQLHHLLCLHEKLEKLEMILKICYFKKGNRDQK